MNRMQFCHRLQFQNQPIFDYEVEAVTTVKPHLLVADWQGTLPLKP